MNKKQKLFENIDKGLEKEIEIRGVKLLVRTPDLEDRYKLYPLLQNIKEGNKNLDVKELAKIVANCTFDPDTGELFFSKGDIDILIKDRFATVDKIAYHIFELMEQEEKIDIEEAKKN